MTARSRIIAHATEAREVTARQVCAAVEGAHMHHVCNVLRELFELGVMDRELMNTTRGRPA